MDDDDDQDYETLRQYEDEIYNQINSEESDDHDSDLEDAMLSHIYYKSPGISEPRVLTDRDEGSGNALSEDDYDEPPKSDSSVLIYNATSSESTNTGDALLPVANEPLVTHVIDPLKRADSSG